MVPCTKSYTGEDMVEIHAHGSKAVVHEILNNLSKINGCRIAEPRIHQESIPE